MTGRVGRQDSTLSNVEHLAWKSLRTLMLIGVPELERSFRRYGLVQLEYQILVELYDTRGGMRLGELAATLQVSPSRLSHRMEKLTKGALVTLESTETDARGTAAVVTHTGRVLVDRLVATHEHDLRRILFEPLQQQQVRALADALSTIAAALTIDSTDGLLDDEGAPPRAPAQPSRGERRWRNTLLKEWGRRSS